MDIAYDKWRSVYSFSTCPLIDHPGYIAPFGQTVISGLIADGNQYNCLNRGDENPFLITNSESNETETDSKTWTQWINTPCSEDVLRQERRCLGLSPEICVNSDSK